MVIWNASENSIRLEIILYTLTFVSSSVLLVERRFILSCLSFECRFGRIVWYDVLFFVFLRYISTLFKAMGKDSVTIYEPPNSVHFDMSARLGPPKQASAEEIPVIQPEVKNAVANQVTNHLPLPQQPIYPQQPAYQPPPPWMYGHYPMPGPFPQAPLPLPYPPFTNYPALPYGQQPGAFPAWLPAKDSPTSSPATALKLGVPLSEFCARYNISKSDENKLALLEYKPGNNDVTTLTSEDWKGVQFSVLGWKAFLIAHKQFIRDVRDGSWLT
jgi:hypothetical protein